MFIGRERELATLNRLYSSNQFEFVVIHGCRRVGKTALINRFIEGKKVVYFASLESNAKYNLESFSKSIIEYHRIETNLVFRSFLKALEYAFQLAEKERLVLVIDEYPYVARSSKSFVSTLQRLIDKYKDSSKLMLILCGASFNIDVYVLDHKSPFYGRQTAHMKIAPFDFKEASRYLKNFSDKDKALIYGIFGGTPQYLLQINDKLSVKDNIKNTYLNPNSAIFEEPLNILRREVREPAQYNAILAAIATGASRMSEISSTVGESTNICSAYVKKLILLGIIRKDALCGEKVSRRAIYSIEDNMFRFWYRFVPENSSLIARGAADLAYKRIEPFLSDYHYDF